VSKKDFIVIAAGIKARVEAHSGDTSAQALVRVALNDLANDYADVFEADNPRFNRTSFKDACGLIR
jgi:hypothetical protein